MPKLIELNKNTEIVVSSSILKFLTPDKVYFKIYEDTKILVDIGTKVKIGTPLLKTKKNILTSSISGEITELSNINNEEFLVVSNDFAEDSLLEPIIKKNSNNLKKEVLDKILNKEFKLDLNNKCHLVLNALDDEPYVLTENFYLFLYYEGFLELLDLLSKIYKFDITICVKASSSENINKLMECLGMYPNIKLDVTPDFYLLGESSFLKDYLKLSDDTEVIKASLFYHIYNLIERNRLMGDKLITISGDGLLNPSIIEVKIGTKLTDILKEMIKLKDVDLVYIKNGLMRGNIITSLDNLTITNDFNSLLIMQKKEETKPSSCLNCGACLDICPVNLNPKLLNDKKYLEYAKTRCLNCGLCSYICPSYINFNTNIRGDENV